MGVGKGLGLATSPEDGQGIELLGAEEVARLLGVKESTIWRWCREGRLPCLKVGKHWRMRRGALEDLLREKERSTTLVGQMDSYLRVPDNVLAIAQDLDRCTGWTPPSSGSARRGTGCWSSFTAGRTARRTSCSPGSRRTAWGPGA